MREQKKNLKKLWWGKCTSCDEIHVLYLYEYSMGGGMVYKGTYCKECYLRITERNGI